MPARKTGANAEVRERLLYWSTIILRGQRDIEDLSGCASPIADAERAKIQKLEQGAPVVVTADELQDVLWELGHDVVLRRGDDYRVQPDGSYALA